jgi:hypothetical protein
MNAPTLEVFKAYQSIGTFPIAAGIENNSLLFPTSVSSIARNIPYHPNFQDARPLSAVNLTEKVKYDTFGSNGVLKFPSSFTDILSDSNRKVDFSKISSKDPGLQSEETKRLFMLALTLMMAKPYTGLLFINGTYKSINCFHFDPWYHLQAASNFSEDVRKRLENPNK